MASSLAPVIELAQRAVDIADACTDEFTVVFGPKDGPLEAYRHAVALVVDSHVVSVQPVLSASQASLTRAMLTRILIGHPDFFRSYPNGVDIG